MATERRVGGLLKIGAILVGSLFLLGTVWWGGRALLAKFFWNNPAYLISEIEITVDTAIHRQMVLDAAGIEIGQNIFTVDLSGAHRRLRALPQVQEAKVVRTLPGRIDIVVEARRPVAWIAPSPDVDDEQLARNSFLVDATGFVFPELDPDAEHFKLPFVYGCPELPVRPGQVLQSPQSVAALELLKLTAKTPLGVRLQIQQIDLSKRYCMEVQDRRRAAYLFGIEPSELRMQVEQLEALLRAIDQDGRQIRKVNLLVRRNIPVVFAGTTPVDQAPVALQERAPTLLTPTTPPANRQQPNRVAATAETPRRQNSSTSGRAAPAANVVRKSSPPARPVQRAVPERGAHNVPLKSFLNSSGATGR